MRWVRPRYKEAAHAAHEVAKRAAVAGGSRGGGSGSRGGGGSGGGARRSAHSPPLPLHRAAGDGGSTAALKTRPLEATHAQTHAATAKAAAALGGKEN